MNENVLLGKRFRLPGQCPICGRTLVATVTQTVDDHGFDLVDMVEMTCITEPKELSGGKLREFMRSHFSQPYIDWVPIQDDVILAINKKVMKKYGLEWDAELETWFDPKQPSDNPYDVNW